ncbi:hypothetical protein PGB90_003540 [Kerria lacca]
MSWLTTMQNRCRLHTVAAIWLNASIASSVDLPAQNPYWHSEIPTSALRWALRRQAIIIRSKSLPASSNRQISL